MTHSPLATPSATLSVLKAHGLATKKRLGQHFLVDDNVIGRTLALAHLSRSDVVLEVGPGIGTLSLALCASAGSVVAVERDAALEAVLADTVAGCESFALVAADAVDVCISDIVAPFGPPTALVANLPYNIAATVVLRFLEELPSLKHATVMVQSEVADRMAASPGNKAYGSYTVKLRLLATPAGRFQVAPTSFLPPPRVDSAVLRLERHPITDDVPLMHAAFRVANAAFAQRRKTIRSAVVRLGQSQAILLAKILHGVTIPALALFGWGAGFGAWYFAGVVAAGGILAYEHQLVKPGDLSKLNAAFFNMNAVMSVTVFAFAMLDVLF
jgi:16S rRNA (adenine1518-N6/adenine1519-N6)-dimethyltransferase